MQCAPALGSLDHALAAQAGGLAQLQRFGPARAVLAHEVHRPQAAGAVGRRAMEQDGLFARGQRLGEAIDVRRRER
jgi:hypothetical protein